MICSQTPRSAYILIEEEHEYVLTRVLCFSEFSLLHPQFNINANCSELE